MRTNHTPIDTAERRAAELDDPYERPSDQTQTAWWLGFIAIVMLVVALAMAWLGARDRAEPIPPEHVLPPPPRASV